MIQARLNTLALSSDIWLDPGYDPVQYRDPIPE
ncbi:MAG: hypothetical protein RL701_1202 [Pseudomonadota bacterium]|jgi:hypothetical protein